MPRPDQRKRPQMPDLWIILLIHQLLFQGMFVLKNILLRRQTGKQIRGNNIEANLAIVFFILFTGSAISIAFFDPTFGKFTLVAEDYALLLGFGLLGLNLIISGASLLDLKDSWRVGVIETQTTKLVTTGIYHFSRNPYFASYLLMFAAYTVILQNGLLLALSIGGFLFIQNMIKKEETYLLSVHGDAYLQYKKQTPRYILVPTNS